MTLGTSPLTYRYLQGDFLTSSYRVVGKIMVSSTGTIALLSDPTHSVLEVHDAQLARLDLPEKMVDHFELIRMLKQHLHAVCMPRREDLGPYTLVRGGYASVDEYPIRLSTEVFELEGIMEFPGRFDLPTLLTEGTRDFIPVFEATLTGIMLPNLRIESGGLLINRRHIDTLAMQNQRVKL